MSLKEKVYQRLPLLLQNLAISGFNTLQYKTRHGGEYWKWRQYYENVEKLPREQLKKMQQDRLELFLAYASTQSSWYRKYRNFSLSQYPILEKDDILNNLDSIATISEKDAQVSLTGGTTGASMKVLYTKENMQERHALLDHFRAHYGYHLGDRCAWFSGKNIINDKNIAKGICYRDDYINKIRFFSTFHITDNSFEVYWSALNDFSPEYLVGFPSSVYEICAMAQSRGLKLQNSVKAFFPTAETLLPIHRDVISSVLGCKIANQYASSEGAPFILECKYGGLHMHPLTGIFEVVDEDMKPTQDGEVLVTSFATKGTPLIRYRIGDRIRLAPQDEMCICGSGFPLVNNIEGRAADFILSPTHGRVNSVNISNSTKGIKGIIQFQVVQDNLDSVLVLVKGTQLFNHKEQEKLKLALSERFGPKLEIKLVRTDEISKESSGKFKVIKNLLV